MTQITVTNGTAAISAVDDQTPLSDAERVLLAACEEKIERSLEGFYIIKSQRLYREFGSWSDYCEKRWNFTERRGNQLAAGFGVILILREAFQGTGVPVPSTEYGVRPLISLAESNPEQAVAVYQRAIEIANGAAPSHTQVTEARDLVVGVKKSRVEEARTQLAALFDDNPSLAPLEREYEKGANPLTMLALVDAIKACDLEVQRQVIRYSIHDTGIIRRVNQMYRDRTETAEEIFSTGYLQFAERDAVKFQSATLKDLQALLDEKWKEHIRQQRDERKGQAVSVVVFPDDMAGTLESLRQVLSNEALLELGRLICGEKS